MTFDLDRSIAVLERTPAALDRLLSGLPEEWITRNEGVDSWSPFDVVGHLIHGERTDWIPRARLILETGEQPAFTPFDRFAQFEASRGRPLGDLLAEFASLRRENLETLGGWRLGPARKSRRQSDGRVARPRHAEAPRVERAAGDEANIVVVQGLAKGNLAMPSQHVLAWRNED